MNSTNVLRLVVAVYIAVVVLFLGLSFIPQKFPAEAISYMEWRARQPVNVVTRGATVVVVIALIASIISAIGLLFWRSIARLMFICSIFLMLFTDLFMGLPMVISGVDGFLNTLASILAGLAIALSYFSSSSEKFQNKRQGIY